MTDDKHHNIAEYDSTGYDYEDYWKKYNRNYEDESDKLAISRMLEQESGDWFIDIGGSYGRLVDLYRTKYLKCVLADYSLELLKKAKQRMKSEKIRNFEFVAMNVYHSPFKNNSFAGGQMIRVMHHLDTPKDAMGEISRILEPKGIFVLEFANKIHFLAKLRALSKLNLKFIFDKSSYRQPSRKSKQGSEEDPGLFFNMHPGHIKKVAKSSGLKIIKKLSVSNFRSRFLKKIFSTKILFRLEKIFQRPLSLCSFGPSQYFKLQKEVEGEKVGGASILENICCPKCKGELEKSGGNLLCEACRESFPISYGIYDLRWPRPTISR